MCVVVSRLEVATGFSVLGHDRAVTAGKCEKFCAAAASFRCDDIAGRVLNLSPVSKVVTVGTGATERPARGPVRHSRPRLGDLRRQHRVIALRKVRSVFHGAQFFRNKVAPPVGRAAPK